VREVREFGLFMVVAAIAYGLPVILSLQSLSEFASEGYFELSIGDVLYYRIIASDAFWIFKNDIRKRLVYILCKTDVLNESPAI